MGEPVQNPADGGDTCPVETPPGHPVDTFHRENEAIRRVVEEMRGLVRRIRSLSQTERVDEILDRWRLCFNDLVDIEKHYTRKEQLLFSRLERHEVTCFTRVTWARHDEIRQFLKRLGRELARTDNTAGTLIALADSTAAPVLEDIEAVLAEEEDVLLPAALRTLTPTDWGEIWRFSHEFGWCLVAPREAYRPPETAPSVSGYESQVPPCQVLFPTGSLSVAQLRSLLAALPVDLTFVDADDRVCYFTPGRDRIFDRSVAILGRKVENCHPPKSVHFVRQIIADFRNRRQSKAEFWIQPGGKFVHIQFLAIRDEAGEYLGALEVAQDITRLRALEGERRLLQYDSGPQPSQVDCPP